MDGHLVRCPILCSVNTDQNLIQDFAHEGGGVQATLTEFAATTLKNAAKARTELVAAGKVRAIGASNFTAPRLAEAHRVLAPTGTMYIHLDYREVHYARVLLDEIFGRECFLNEIVWAYDYGGRATDRWPRKHDSILWYAKGEQWVFDRDAIDRTNEVEEESRCPRNA